MPAAPAPCPPRRFPTDLTDAQWRLLAPLLPAPRSSPGRPGRPATCRRALVNAILYVLWTGCPGGPCPRATRTGAPCTTTSPAGPPTARCSGCMRCFEVERAWPPAARRHPPPRSSTRSRCAQATGSHGPARATTPPRRSTAASGTWRWTPAGCCWTSWSPPPASRTVMVAAGCCGAFAATSHDPAGVG